MNRIEEKMTALKNEGRKAFITYTTAGLPDMETAKDYYHKRKLVRFLASGEKC